MNMGNVFIWNQSFLTGLGSVDEQHQRLVDLINDVGELAMSAETISPEQFQETHRELVDYARFHFADEERQMEETGLEPAFIAAHRAAHRSFVEKAQALGQHAHNDQQQLHELLHYLVRWLAYHILGIDQQMARQIQAVQAGRSPTEAYREDQEFRKYQESAEPLLQAMEGLYAMVSERNRSLRELNRSLEERVNLRTGELQKANQLLRSMAIHDDLTGLPNRRAAMVALHAHFSEGSDRDPVAVLLLDADEFKLVNDRFGHDEGDAILRDLAQRMNDSVRTSDLVCRLGGDEFLIICRDSSLDGAREVADKILKKSQPKRQQSGQVTWPGSVSIGIAEYRPGMSRPEELLKAADQALYRAKRAGGNRYWPG